MAKKVNKINAPEQKKKSISKIETQVSYFTEEILDEEEDEEDELEEDYIRWQKVGKNSYFPVGEMIFADKLKPGVYNISFSEQRHCYYAIHKKLALDELFIFPDDKVQDSIIKDIQTFWTRKEQFRKYKYNYRRGILLWGAPGNGKTSIVNLLCKELVEKHKGVIFFLAIPDDLGPFIQFIQNYFKSIEPNTNILCVIEDIENFCSSHRTEGELLNLLDGMNQMENIVFIANTNYPENLKERLLNRPARFDRRYEIKAPNAKNRAYYFKCKLKPEDLEVIDLKKWVKDTKGFSISHLGEVVKSVCALGNTFEETIERLREMERPISSYDYKKGNRKAIGFNNEDEYDEEDDNDYAIVAATIERQESKFKKY